MIYGGQLYTKKDVLYILPQLIKEALIVEEENLIIMDDFKFIFIIGKLSEVKG